MDLLAGHPLKGRNQIKDRNTFSGTKVKCGPARYLRCVNKRIYMATREIFNMNIIADPGSVWSVIVVAKNNEFTPLATRHIEDQRHQIVWNTFRALANQSRIMCSDWIEISQQHRRATITHSAPVAQNFLNEQLGPAVGVCRSSVGILPKWRGTDLSIDCRRG